MLAGIANKRVVKNLNGFFDFLPGIRLFSWAWGGFEPPGKHEVVDVKLAARGLCQNKRRNHVHRILLCGPLGSVSSGFKRSLTFSERV